MIIFMSRALCGSILQAITFKGMGEELSDFAVLYGQYPTLHNKSTKSLYKSIFWRITMMQILIIIAVASHSTIFLVHNMQGTSFTILPILISLFNSLLLYVMYFPPSVTGKQIVKVNEQYLKLLFFSDIRISAFFPGHAEEWCAILSLISSNWIGEI